MGWRPVRSRVAAVLAGLLVLALLLMPSEPSQLTPAAVLRLPLEGLLGAAILLVLPERARRIAAVLVGVCLCTLAAAKLLDLGFSTVLARPFDPITDWPLLGNAIEFVSESTGRTGAVVVVVATAAVTGVVGLAAVWAVRRLTTLLADHRVVAGRVVAALFVVWAVVALTGVHVVPGVPVAVHELDRWRQLPHSLLDHRDFRAQLAQDAFADVPPEELLTALRGKDVIVAFVESYGRAAVTDPRFASEVGAVLDDGWRRLSARGFDARSAYLTSPVVGGGSWLAHATLLSGVSGRPPTALPHVGGQRPAHSQPRLSTSWVADAGGHARSDPGLAGRGVLRLRPRLRRRRSRLPRSPLRLRSHARPVHPVRVPTVRA